MKTAERETLVAKNLLLQACSYATDMRIGHEQSILMLKRTLDVFYGAKGDKGIKDDVEVPFSEFDERQLEMIKSVLGSQLSDLRIIIRRLSRIRVDAKRRKIVVRCVRSHKHKQTEEAIAILEYYGYGKGSKQPLEADTPENTRPPGGTARLKKQHHPLRNNAGLRGSDGK